MDIISFSNHFEGVIWNGTEKIKCFCPAHDDRAPSLHVSILDDKILVHCFAGCYASDILEIIGLQFKDLFLTSSLNPEKKRQYAKKKNRLETLRILNREMFILTRFNDSRLNDSELSRDKNYLKFHPEFRPMPNETWEREEQAIKRINKLTSEFL